MMNQNIKTGAEIVRMWLSSENKVGEFKGESFEQQYVPLSWLKDKLSMRYELQEKGTENRGWNNALDWVLSLLEESK